MSQKDDRVASAHPDSDHCVQLFDDGESLAETVAAFLCEGWLRNEGLLVVARADNWERISQRMNENDCLVSGGLSSGRLVVIDADIMLARLLRNGYLIRERFTDSLGGLVSDLTLRFGQRLRVYGEMVDILTARSDFAVVLELEQLWNELASKYPFTVLCGYLSTHFGDARRAGVLREICQLHDRAAARPTDLLASWLLAERQSRFHTDAVRPE